MTENKWILGVDVGKQTLQISCCQKNQDEITEALYQLPKEPEEETIIYQIREFLKEQQLFLRDGDKMILSFSEISQDNMKAMKEKILEEGWQGSEIRFISRENAFVHYVTHQEMSLYDHTVLLFDFDGTNLYGYRLEYPKKKTPKRFQVEKSAVGSFDLLGNEKDRGRVFDEHFASAARQLLSKEVVSAVFLTGKGFEGDWLSKSLNVICSGRRAFIGQNLFSSGCCYCGMDEGEEKDYMVCAPETVLYESGVVDGASDESFVTITKAGRAWYETKGSIDVILERGGKLDVVFSNLLLMEKQVESIDVSALPKRPRKTGRLRVEVQFLGSNKGLITVRDLGFGAFSPATHQVVMKEFSLL